MSTLVPGGTDLVAVLTAVGEDVTDVELVDVELVALGAATVVPGGAGPFVEVFDIVALLQPPRNSVAEVIMGPNVGL